MILCHEPVDGGVSINKLGGKKSLALDILWELDGVETLTSLGLPASGEHKLSESRFREPWQRDAWKPMGFPSILKAEHVKHPFFPKHQLMSTVCGVLGKMAHLQKSSTRGKKIKVVTEHDQSVVGDQSLPMNLIATSLGDGKWTWWEWDWGIHNIWLVFSGWWIAKYPDGFDRNSFHGIVGIPWEGNACLEQLHDIFGFGMFWGIGHPSWTTSHLVTAMTLDGKSPKWAVRPQRSRLHVEGLRAWDEHAPSFTTVLGCRFDQSQLST